MLVDLLLLEFVRLSVPFCSLSTGTDGVLFPIVLPIRKVLPELRRLSELAAGCFASVGAGDSLVPIELPMREPIRLLVLVRGCVFEIDSDGVFPPAEVSIRVPELLVGCVLVVDLEGASVPIGVPIRIVLPELMLVLGLVIVRVLLLELTPVDLVALEEPADGWRALVEVGGLDVVIRPDVRLPELLLVVILVEREVVGILVVFVLLELLWLGSLEALELVGVRTVRELVLLLRLLLALEDELALGAGAGFETCCF